MPQLATTNRTQLTYKPEATPGTPVSASACYCLRMTGESLNYDLKKESDKEIRSDRQRTSATTIGASVGGGINLHMQYGEYDSLFEALTQSTWVAAGTNGVASGLATVTVATGTTTPVIAGTGMPVLAKGQWFKFSHTLYTPTGGTLGSFILLRASTSVAPSATSITVDASTPFNTATVSSGTGVIQAARLANGSGTPKSFTLEMQINDVAVPVYMTYKGVYVNKFSTSFNSGAMTEGSFDFLGMSAASGTAKLLHATATASLGYDVQNAVTGVGKLWEAGVPLTSTSIKTMSMSVDNSMRGQEAIGTLGYVGVGTGTFVVNGSIEVYFADGSLYNKFLADTYTSLIVSTQDAAGNGYVFSFPKVMLTSAKIDSGSKDADLMASFNWEAYADVANADAALQKTMFIDRVGAAVTPAV